MQTKPSATAAVVASTLLLLRGDADLEPLADPATHAAVESAVRRAIPAFGALLDLVPWPLLRRAALGVERAASPGFVAHYALRKHAIRELVAQSVSDGFRQVVMVGAGFDMLSSSVDARATIFEVDHPATQEIKREALRGARSRQVTYVPVDLARDDLRRALVRAEGFRPDAPTLYVAEGLLMYLPSDRVGAVLGDMRGPARVIFTVVTPDRAGRVRLHSQRAMVDWVMRHIDEPFVWGESGENLAGLLRAHGLRMDRAFTTADHGRRVLGVRTRARLPRPTGELVVVAHGEHPVEASASPVAP